jgi:hypothetical protein
MYSKYIIEIRLQPVVNTAKQPSDDLMVSNLTTLSEIRSGLVSAAGKPLLHARQPLQHISHFNNISVIILRREEINKRRLLILQHYLRGVGEPNLSVDRRSSSANHKPNALARSALLSPTYYNGLDWSPVFYASRKKVSLQTK